MCACVRTFFFMEMKVLSGGFFVLDVQNCDQKKKKKIRDALGMKNASGRNSTKTPLVYTCNRKQYAGDNTAYSTVYSILHQYEQAMRFYIAVRLAGRLADFHRAAF